jgi:hypothetical protein
MAAGMVTVQKQLLCGISTQQLAAASTYEKKLGGRTSIQLEVRRDTVTIPAVPCNARSCFLATLELLLERAAGPHQLPGNFQFLSGGEGRMDGLFPFLLVCFSFG